VDEGLDYAFPHSDADESRRLQLLEQRLDPITQRRVQRLGISAGATCLEIGGGRGSVTRFLSKLVGPSGKVTATDLQLGFLNALELPNVEVLRHDIRSDSFPEGMFDLVHTRAVLMHIPANLELLVRVASWLAPGGWLLLEEPDFGMWQGDADPLWSSHPQSWHDTFPHGSLSRGRWLLQQIGRLGLEDVGADAEMDVIHGGTPLAEFYQLSQTALAPSTVRSGARTADEVKSVVERLGRDDFFACGFVHVGVWGRTPT
jgi:SAM-dependent methyltransferase